MKNKRIAVLLIINVILVIIFLLCFSITSIILNQNSYMKKEKKTIKEMSETTQVSDLQAQINQLNTAHTEYANYVQSCKETIATAITNQGVETTVDSTAEVMAENIGKILQNGGNKVYEATTTSSLTYNSTIEGKIIIFASGVRCTGNSNIPRCSFTKNGTSTSWDIYGLQSSSNGGQTAYNRYCIKVLDINNGDSLVFSCYCNWYVSIYSVA